MSHRTGITACNELQRIFDVARSGRLRHVKVVIESEQLVLASSGPPASSWEEDYDRQVLPCLVGDQPCYIFYRLDTRLSGGRYNWLFISYTPDGAHVRQKMLYAATTMTVKKDFGTEFIIDELFGTTVADVNLAGYRHHINSQLAPKLFTNAEKELELIRQNEAEMRLQGKRQLLKNVAFPLLPTAVAALQDLAAGAINYVQLSLNIKAEKIELENAGSVNAVELWSVVPLDQARYHFYTFTHYFNGGRFNSTVFIYSIPSSGCPIKERMLYSTCKGPLVEFAEQQIGLTIARKLETDDPKEITESYLIEEIHSKLQASAGSLAGRSGGGKMPPFGFANLPRY